VLLQSYQGDAAHEMLHCISLYTKQRSTGLWAFQLLCHPFVQQDALLGGVHAQGLQDQHCMPMQKALGAHVSEMTT